MAINAQELLLAIQSTDLSQTEQICIDYLEGLYDKELLQQFTGSEVKLKKQTYFTDVLRNMNINKGRDTIVFDKLVEIYDAAGWLLKTVVEPQYDVLSFTIKPIL